MSWTRPADLVAQMRRLWDRGVLLSGSVTGEPIFPLRLKLRGPGSAELVDRFDEVRTWVAELRAMPHCRIEWREFRHRVRGSNAIPDRVWVDSFADALALIGRQRDAASFDVLLETTRARQPGLISWLARRPLRALELADDWLRLLDIVAWLQVHPRPGIYLRQVDIPGVHSKFVEGHRGVLSELLDEVLPSDAIDADAGGVTDFNRRFGFLDKPGRVRLRLLDPGHRLLPGVAGGDITLDAHSFRALRCDVSRVFITENEINFLSFPSVADSLVLFGAGYGFELLDRCAWLQRCRLYYWGDIDTHGFAILDQLRARFPEVRSFLMDRATLMAFESLWSEEHKPVTHELPRLTADERALFNDLRDQRIRPKLRLEQEFIGFDWVRAALAAC